MGDYRVKVLDLLHLVLYCLVLLLCLELRGGYLIVSWSFKTRSEKRAKGWKVKKVKINRSWEGIDKRRGRT